MGRVKEELFTVYDEQEEEHDFIAECAELSETIAANLEILEAFETFLRDDDVSLLETLTDVMDLREHVDILEEHSNGYEKQIQDIENAIHSNECHAANEIAPDFDVNEGIDFDELYEYQQLRDAYASAHAEYDALCTAYEERIERVKKAFERIAEAYWELNPHSVHSDAEEEAPVGGHALPCCEEEEDEKVTKGRTGELAFQEWLDTNNFAYIYVNQDKETFSHLFHGNVKRPDFLVLIDSIGLIAVDVKNTKYFNGNAYTLPIESELKRTLTFERLFRIPVWYAFSDNQSFDKWYWINSLKVVEVGREYVNRSTKKTFYAILLSEFIEIADNKDFGRLWTQRFESLSSVKAFSC